MYNMVIKLINRTSVPKCDLIDELLNGEIVLSMPEEGVEKNKTKVFFSCNAGRWLWTGVFVTLLRILKTERGWAKQHPIWGY